MGAAIGLFLRGNWHHLLIGALVLFAIWKIDQNGYNRAKSQFEEAERRRDAMERKLTAKIETKIGEGIAQLDRRLTGELGAIDGDDRTIIQPIIQREIERDPRYRDPKCSISDELRRALDRSAGAEDPPATGEHR